MKPGEKVVSNFFFLPPLLYIDIICGYCARFDQVSELVCPIGKSGELYYGEVKLNLCRIAGSVDGTKGVCFVLFAHYSLQSVFSDRIRIICFSLLADYTTEGNMFPLSKDDENF